MLIESAKVWLPRSGTRVWREGCNGFSNSAVNECEEQWGFMRVFYLLELEECQRAPLNLLRAMNEPMLTLRLT